MGPKPHHGTWIDSLPSKDGRSKAGNNPEHLRAPNFFITEKSNVDRSRNQAWHVPRPPPRSTVRLLGPESAWGCSRSDGLGLTISKLVLKVGFGGRTPVLAPGEDLKI